MERKIVISSVFVAIFLLLENFMFDKKRLDRYWWSFAEGWILWSCILVARVAS